MQRISQSFKYTCKNDLLRLASITFDSASLKNSLIKVSKEIPVMWAQIWD